MGEVIPFNSLVGNHGQVAKNSNGAQIGSGHVQHGKVHADFIRGPLKSGDAEAVGQMLLTLAHHAKQEHKGKKKKSGS
jgi:hypothetical protein